mmetsp:Transcript_21579/g.34560  ORF Transcript_21579/g.34560 Transcript_21579/m.34560 type:complete len:126 (-) Transcript_21579:3-380(-)
MRALRLSRLVLDSQESSCLQHTATHCHTPRHSRLLLDAQERQTLGFAKHGADSDSAAVAAPGMTTLLVESAESNYAGRALCVGQHKCAAGQGPRDIPCVCAAMPQVRVSIFGLPKDILAQARLQK